MIRNSLAIFFVMCLSIACIEAPPQVDNTSSNNSTSNNSTSNNSTSNNSTSNNSTSNNTTTNNTTTIGPTPGKVGAACVENTDCETAVCLPAGTFGFPGGYCTKGCTQDDQCPTGAHCGLLDPANGRGLCLRSCGGDNDCAREGFGCYDFEIDLTSECWPIGNGLGKLGERCEDTNDCSGGQGAFCLTQQEGFYEGYCSKRCATNPNCGPDGSCVNGSCAAKMCGDRDIGYEMGDFNGSGEHECWLAGTGEGAIGEPCDGVWECDGGVGSFCMATSDGYCSRGCSPEIPCGADAACVIGSTGSFCLATCDGAVDSCREDYTCFQPAAGEIVPEGSSVCFQPGT